MGVPSFRARAVLLHARKPAPRLSQYIILAELALLVHRTMVFFKSPATKVSRPGRKGHSEDRTGGTLENGPGERERNFPERLPVAEAMLFAQKQTSMQ